MDSHNHSTALALIDLIRNISSAIVQCGFMCLLEFFIVFKPKNKKKSSGQMRQLYAYVAIDLARAKSEAPIDKFII